jgi:hypothetical protein
MHKLPYYMTLAYPGDDGLTQRFKSYVETGYTNIQGINDMSVDFASFTGGFAGQTFQTVSLVKDESDTLTIQMYEITGSPVREFLETWVTGVRDPRSGIAHYHGRLYNAKMESLYAEINHTAEFIYTVLDPTARDIEFAAMFAHCFPTKVPKSHLNYESGSRDGVQMDVEFRTTKYESPAINHVGYWYNQASLVEYNYLKFTPNIVDAAASHAARPRTTSTIKGVRYTPNNITQNVLEMNEGGLYKDTSNTWTAPNTNPRDF